MKRLAAAFALVLSAWACSNDETSPFEGRPIDSPKRDGGGGVDAAVDLPADATPVDAATGPCPSGTKLRKTLTSCPGTPTSPPAALVSAVQNGAAGDVISFAGMDEESAPCLPVVTCTPNDAPVLLFSDSPESPAADGVLYADTVPKGRYRIYVYHANGGTAARKFPVVVLNQNATAATVTIRRRGVGAPSQAYVDIGKSVLADWYSDMTPVTVNVPAGQRVLLDPLLDEKHADKFELVHAIYDVDVDATVKFSVVSVLSGADAAATTGGLSLLARDEHDRGTFEGADVLVVGQGGQKSGVQRMRLGLNEVDDDLLGIDKTTGNAARLAGNYGLQYRFALQLNQASKAAIAPRGGGWGGVAKLPKLTSLPSDTEQVDGATNAVLLGDIGKSEVSVLTAGGSSLPVDLFFVTP